MATSGGKPKVERSFSLKSLSGQREADRQLRLIFSQIDIDGDGGITLKEMENFVFQTFSGVKYASGENAADVRMLKNFGIDNNFDVTKMFDLLDLDKSGAISFDEFKVGLMLSRARSREGIVNKKYKTKHYAIIAGTAALIAAIGIALFQRR